MKKLLFSLLIAAWSTSVCAIDASVSYATFKSPAQNYIEVYLHISGPSVAFKTVGDSSLMANVEVTILFKQGEEIIKFDKFILNSPVSTKKLDFIDLKRYGLENGEYRLIVALKDLNRPENAKEFQTDFSINYSDSQLQQSSLQLLASFERAEGRQNMFVRNGIQMEPLPYNFYSRHSSALSFYNEIYNAGQAIGEDFLVTYYIEEANNEDGKPIMIGHKRQAAKPIVPLLIKMDISRLPSGNYNLVVEIRNRAKELLSKKGIFFQRSNPFLEEESITLADVNLEAEFVQQLQSEQLEYSLRALTPRIPTADVELVNNMIKKDNVEGMRLYIFSYWAKESPNNPEYAYRKYMEVAAAIDEQFNSGFRHGFETDRGYIYLKYGQPDDIEGRNTEPSAPPYEIWSYYEFPRTNQNNVKFVFYNPSLAPGDFQLLHSTAIGEINNPQWQRELYRNAPEEIQGSDYFGGTEMLDNFNRNASRVFSDY